VIPTFVIFLREGIEMSMVVAVLCAYLDKIGQRRYIRDVLAGVGAAVVLSLLAGVAIYQWVHTWSGTRAQTIFETVTYLLAAAILTYMTIWMRRHARTISTELRDRTDVALSTGERRGLFLLSFQAVGREGLETVVFTLAIVFSTSGRGALWGGLAGLVVSLGIAFSIFRLGAKLNLGRFFKVLGILLIIFAAGLVADAVGNLQELGWLPILTHPMWSTDAVLAESSALGDILHTLLGYSSQPTPLQLLAWVGYVAVAFLAIRRVGHPEGERHHRRTSARPAARSAAQ